MFSFLVIEIPWGPNIAKLGPFLISWHGFFTAVGILGGVQLALWIVRRTGYDEDHAYNLALVGVPSGIIGARILFVLEHWSFYSSNPGQILALTEGGISVWGAVIGGVLGSLLFALWRGYEIRRGLDAAGFGLITGMAIGRLGDLVNGEHLALSTSLPWGVVYTHPDSPGFAHSLDIGTTHPSLTRMVERFGEELTFGAVHPATTYEMLGDLVILGAMFWLLFGLLRRRPGLTFFVFLVGYAVMRFAVTYLRVDSSDTFVPGLRVPQLVSVVVVLASLPAIFYLLRQPPVEDPRAPAGSPPADAARAPDAPPGRR